MVSNAPSAPEARPHTDAPEFIPFVFAQGRKTARFRQVEHIAFDLYPVSYLFKRAIPSTLSVSGGDKDHFKAVVTEGNWMIQHNGAFAPRMCRITHRLLMLNVEC